MSVPRFWRRLKNLYNLIGTHCEKCKGYFYPPRNMCPKCRRTGKIIPHKFHGVGEVLTYTIIHSATRDFEKQTPYILAIIKLDEGPRLTSQVICDHNDIHIGMRVISVFRRLGEESEKGMIYYGTKFVPQPPAKTR
ncbi:MAG: Zn-ribbon domain-containing OB-fold protein [Candidatus Methanoperedens sp.]|nr:Zn-ribbon domain-containing OB-fold protein [Candidatus Methanoperedens sp.]MCE8424445.1 Zn-ribbon domain-containing OB-fold protein [Candidatus Methanoperedens sp.]MCE8427004.1 Zn-ribbon domain-containing OB-fold protein [Candidatus Methanoperedens sp.]